MATRWPRHPPSSSLPAPSRAEGSRCHTAYREVEDGTRISGGVLPDRWTEHRRERSQHAALVRAPGSRVPRIRMASERHRPRLPASPLASDRHNPDRVASPRHVPPPSSQPPAGRAPGSWRAARPGSCQRPVTARLPEGTPPPRHLATRWRLGYRALEHPTRPDTTRHQASPAATTGQKRHRRKNVHARLLIEKSQATARESSVPAFSPRPVGEGPGDEVPAARHPMNGILRWLSVPAVTRRRLIRLRLQEREATRGTRSAHLPSDRHTPTLHRRHP